jgi:hypothetical protein
MPDFTTPEEKERAAAMDADIIALRRQRVSFDEIGRQMVAKYGRTPGRGPAVAEDAPFNKGYMHQRYLAALAAIPAREAAGHRAELGELLNEVIDVANQIMRKNHVAVSQGRVVREGKPYINDDGEAAIAEGAGSPVPDDAPKLAAAAEIRKAAVELARLYGLNIPVKQEVEHTGAVNYTITGVDMDKLT